MSRTSVATPHWETAGMSGGGGGAKQKHKGRGDDPLYDLSEDELKKLYDDTPSKTKEGKKLRGKIKTIQKHKRLRNIAKRGVGKVAKKVVGRIVPVVGACFFIYDW
ncbi:MAG: hypothetical protein IID42_02870, partial [Planctomycetes bacterium]|nr:hypothetical protein [Planctomycetota bacterium]